MTSKWIGNFIFKVRANCLHTVKWLQVLNFSNFVYQVFQFNLILIISL